MDSKDVAKAGIVETGPTMNDSLVRAYIRHSLTHQCFMGFRNVWDKTPLYSSFTKYLSRETKRNQP